MRESHALIVKMVSNTVLEEAPQPDQIQQHQEIFESGTSELSHGAMEHVNSLRLQEFNSSSRPDAASSTAGSSARVQQNQLGLELGQSNDPFCKQDRSSGPESSYDSGSSYGYGHGRNPSNVYSVAGDQSIISYTEGDAAIVCIPSYSAP